VKVAVLGYAPLPLEPSRRSYSGNFRTWNTIQFLREKGCQVVAIGMRLTGSFSEDYPAEKMYREKNLVYYSVDELSHFHDLDYLKSRLQGESPDCIVGVNSFPAKQAALLQLPIPFWADLNGYIMTEAQSKAFRFNNNRWLHHFWPIEKPVLYEADKFSTATERQKYALIGELATIGRLNKETYNYHFAHTFPNCLDPSLIPPPPEKTEKENDRFSVLWSGTLNTWADVKTLARGIYLAKKELPRLQLILTGGSVKGHDEKTSRIFQEEVEKYHLQDTIKFTGWLELNELDRYLYNSDCGLCIDDFCWESFIGARYRITNMLGYGLPVICTENTEISRNVKNNHLGITIKPRSPEELKKALLTIASDLSTWRKKKKQIQQKALELFHYQKVLQPLGEWVKSPSFSPDHKGFRFPSCSEEELMNVPASTLLRTLTKKAGKRTLKIFKGPEK